MKSIRRWATQAFSVSAVSALAVAFGLVLGGQAAAQAPRALSAADAALYASAFAALEHGDHQGAQALLDRVSDRCLEGYIELDRLMGPKFTATFDDLTGWLGKFADLAGADRVISLAKKRAPRGAALTFESYADDKGRTGLYVSARDAFYSGDAKAAYTLAVASNERWVAGLAAFRLKDYADARVRFESVAYDGAEDAWLRSGAAYWAARAAIAEGEPEAAPAYLKLAARWPQTFYGMLAETQLGYEPGALEGTADSAPARRLPGPSLIKTSYASSGPGPLEALIARDERAKRAAALMQIGRSEAAGVELKRGFARARTDDERQLWIALAVELNSGSQPQVRAKPSRYRPFSPDDFPAPMLEPVGGYTIDRAFVYALVRQESRFNPKVVSGANAIGLMQVRPGTAADAMGDDKFLRDASSLYDPAVNLRAGQDYVDFLLRRWTRGDMIRTVAAYNGGPGAVLKAERNAGLDDPLMIVEALPAHQTRDYVERVMTNYWTYRRMFGQPTRSLDALASGAKIIDWRLDR